MHKARKFYLLGFCISVVLSGCGGGGSSDTPSSTSPELTLSANPDTANSSNGSEITISVLDNDIVPSGTSISIDENNQSAQFGIVEVVNNSLVYTPNSAFFAGTDSFSYTLTNGGVNVEADVTVNITQALTITGISALNESTVTASISEQSIETETDSEGRYTLPLIISDTSQSISVTVNNGDIPSQLSYSTTFTDLEYLIEQSGEDKELTFDESVYVNISPFSTAIDLLLDEAYMQFSALENAPRTQAIKYITPEGILNTAAFIHLINTHEEYLLPEDTSAQTFLSPSQEQTIQRRIDQYVADRKVLGSRKDIIEITKVEILKNEQFFPKMDTETESNTIKVLRHGDTRNGWLSEENEIYAYNQTGGVEYFNKFGFSGGQYEQRVIDGRNTFETDIVNQSRFTIDFNQRFYDLVRNSSAIGFFRDEVVLHMFELLEQNYTPRPLLNVIFDISIPKREQFNIQLSKDYDITYSLVTEIRNISDPFFAPFWDDIDPTEQKEYVLSYISTDKATEFPDLAGTWSIPLRPSVDIHVGSEIDPFEVRQPTEVTLLANGSLTSPFGSGNWEQTDDNTLNLHFLNDLTGKAQQYQINPIEEINGQIQVVVTENTDGDIRYYSGSMKQFDNSLSAADILETFKAQSELTFLQSHTFSYLNSRWEGDKTNIDALFGYKFSDEFLHRGLVYRGIENDKEKYSVVGRRFYSESDGKINVIFVVLGSGNGEPGFYFVQKWKPISKLNGVYEFLAEEVTGYDTNFDLNITGDEIEQNNRTFYLRFSEDNMSNWPGMAEYFQANPLN